MGHRGHIGKTFSRIAAVVLCCGGVLSARATVKVWNDGAGASNTNWASGGAGGNWTGAAAPASGDSLVFAGTLSLTNNNNILANTSFAGITFSNNAGAFLLAGNAIKLTGDVINNSTSTETINLAISLSNTINLNAANGNLTLGGVLSGAGGLTLPGSNVVTLNGGSSANTYSGMTTVNAGELDLAKTAGTAAIGGGLTVGGGTVKLANANQINDTASVTINSGTFNLNGNSEAVDALAGTGGTIINNGAATGTLTIGANNGGGTYAGTITDGSGTLALVKSGTATGTLTGNNAYSGATTINGGVLSASSLANGGASSAIGNSGSQAANLVLNGGTLQYTGAAVTIDRLFSVGTSGGTIDSSGSGGLTLNNTGAMGFNGQAGVRTLTLTGTAMSNTLAAVIGDNTGATSVVKTNTGSWTLSGTNTYSGATTVSQGVLQLGSSGGLSSNSAVSVSSGGTLDLNGQAGTARSVTITSGGGLTNGIAGASLNNGVTNGGTIFVSQATYFNGPVTNTGSIFFIGAISNNLVNRGSFTLNDDSTLTAAPVNTGTLNANGNTLTVNPDWANSGTILLGGGSLAGGNLTNNSGATVMQFGAISNAVINSGNVIATNGELRLVGAVSGAGSYKAAAGASAATLTFAGGGSISALFNTNATVQVASVLTNTGVFANQGTVVLAGGTYQSAANFTNAATKLIVNSGAGTINAAGVFNLGTILATNATVTISNLVAQDGTVTIGNSASLAMLGAGALTNFGTINLQGASGNNAVLNLGTVALTNLANGTITGGGIIQNASQVVNLGTILATNTAVELQFTNANTVGNAGTMGATAGATLTFGTAGVGSAIITNFGTINLTGGTLNSGNITNLATGFLGGNGTVSAPAIINSGVVGATNGNLQINGTASGAGTYRAVAGASAATLTFAGGGSISALFNTNATVQVASVLTNTGAFANQGTIVLAGGTYQSTANFTNAATKLIVNSGAGTINAAGVFNLGTILATNATVTISNLVAQGGTVTIGNSASLAMLGAGALTNFGTINLQGASGNNAVLNLGTVALTNLASGTITGGGIIQNASQVVNLGTILATNTAVELQFTNANTVGNAGTMGAATGATLTFGAAGVGSAIITNFGTINLTGGTLNSGNITNLATGFIGGSGSISAPVINSGIVSATNGELVLEGTVTGAGAYRAGDGAAPGTLTFAGGGSISALFNTNATIQLESALTNNSLFVNQGTIILNAGAYQSSGNFTNATNEFVIASDDGTLGAAVVANRGTLLTTNATLLVSNLVVQSGTVIIGNGGTLTLVGAGALTNFGTINLVGTAGAGNNAVLNLGTVALTNLANGTITGGGIIQNASQVVNLLGGSLLATNTAVELQFTNANTVGNAGTIGAATGATLTFGAAGVGSAIITNFGTINLTGGTLNSGNITNLGKGFVGGMGTITGPLVNNGTVNASGGTLTLVSAPVNNATAIVANASVLNVLTDWTNGGVLSNAATGAVNGGNLTNNGTINGSGFYNSQVVNQDRMNFGGTISNNLLQTAGSFTTISGGSTITGSASINGGALDLSGNQLTAGQLVIAGTGLLTNAVVGATVNGSISNAATVDFSADAYINGPVTNAGFWLQRGAISNNVVNSGTMMVLSNNIAARITGGVVNSGSLTFTNVFVSGPVTNSGSFSFSGAISNSYVQAGGSLTLANTATITGTANVTAGSFDLNGKTYSNGLMVVSGTGVLTSSLANATFNGGLSNAGTVFLPVNTTFNGPITNVAAFSWLGTINSTYAQSAGTNQLLGNSTISGNVSVNGGVMDLNGNTEAFGALSGTDGMILNNGAANGTLTIGANNNSGTYLGTITNGSGTFALVKTGAGTETLNGNNGYSGGTTINNGTLVAGSSTALGSGGLAMTGGTLQLLANLSLANLSGTAGTIGIFSNSISETLTVGSDNSSTTFSGLISQGGNANTHLMLIKSGSGVLTLSGNNSYNGGTTIDGGVLSANTLPNTGSTSSSIGTGSLTLSGGALLYNGFSGGTANFSTTVGVNGGTLNNNAGGAIFYAGTVSGSGTLNVLDSSGNGNQWLFTSASPLFTGPISIGNGSAGSGWLQVRGVTSANQVGTGTVTVNGGGTFSYDTGSAASIANPIILNGGALGAQSVAITYSGPIAISNNSLIGGVQAGVGTTLTLSGVISGPGGFATAGNNNNTTVILTGTNTYGGNTTINSGTVELNNALAVQDSTVSNLVANGLTFGTPTAYTLGGLAGTGNLGLGNVALSVGNNGSNTTYSGVLSGTGSLTKIGTGVLTLSGANTYSGATTISGGTLKLGANNVIPDGAAAGNVTDNATLDMGGFSDTINGLSGSGTVDNSGGGTTLTVGNNNATSVFAGTIQNTGGTLGVTKIGTGILTLSGNNTFSGVLTVQSGTLSVATVNNAGAAGPLGQSASAVVLGGSSTLGTLEYTGISASSTKPFAIGATGDNNTLGGVIQVDNSGTTLTLSGEVYQVNQGLLTKTGSGTLTLAGTDDNVGLGVIVKAGTLVLAKTSSSSVHAIGGAGLTLAGGTVQLGGTGGDQIYDNSVDITVNSGTFDFNGDSETIGGLTGTGGTILNNGGGASTMTVGFNNDSPTYSGTITDHTTGNGTMALAKIGTGTETLSGSNSYSGGTTISGGTLKLGNANALGTGGVNMNGGTLNLNLYSVSIADLSGSSGTILANNGGTAGTYTLTVGSDNTSTTYGGIIANNTDGFSETVALTKSGAGVLTLSGNSTYSGNTVIQSGGAINIQSANALGSTTAGTTVNTGGALQIQGGITTAAEPLTLNGTGVSNDGALRNISGNNTYAGGITLGSASRINSDSGTLTISAFTAGGNFALTIGGAGNTLITAALPATVNSLTKDGTGTLILSNTANAYVGATLISAGTLKLALSNVLPDGAGKGDVTVNGTLDMAGFSDTINGLNGGGTVDNSTGTGNTLTVGNNNANSSFSGVIQNTSGSLALTKTGTGTLTLSGSSANTYSGVTTVNAGELDLNKTAGVNAIGGALTVAGGEVKLLANEQIANGAVVTVNSGSFNLNGVTETTGNMIIGAGGLLTNGVAGGTLNGGITNAGTVFVSQATYLNGPVTNTGAILFIGAVSNSLVNRGSFTLNDDSTLTAAPVNTGTLDANGNTLTVTPDWANSGTILLGGGSLAGGALTNNSGATVMEFGAISNAMVNSGNVIATNGELRLIGVASGAGPYKAAAGSSAATLTFAGGGSISALFNTNATIRLENVLTNTSVFVNQGTLALAGGTYQSAANLTNAAGEVIIGSGTISAARLVNLSTAVLEATNGTLTLLQAPVMQGIVNVRSDGTLQFGNTGGPLVVTNGVGGSIRLYGGTISFSALTNSGNIAAYNGGGTLTGVVINAGSGSIDATNGTLVFLNDLVNGGLITNSAGIQIGATGTGAITNSGTYVFAGGALAANVITNTGTAIGSGADNADMVNSGFVTATNGELRLQGTASGAGTYRAVAGASAATLTFAGGGSISALSNTGATIRVENSILTNNSIFANRGTLTLAGGTYQSSAVVSNASGFQVENAAGTVGTLSAALVNSGTLAAKSGTLTLLAAPVQNGAVNIAATGVLNVVPDWANNGTINFTAGGAITGGNLTNTSASGTIAGAGFINSFLVNQNRLDINGLTVSNNFLQTAGSFTISGASTITGNALFNGGSLNLQGKSLAVNSLILAPGATLTNGTLGATLNGGVTNAGTVNFAADVYVLGPVTNTGTWLQRGAISNEVYNAGTLTLVANTVNPRVTGGLINSGSLLFSNGAGYISGAVTNSGSISFQGAISNNYVQTAGSITLANTATITGTASISGGVFNLNGQAYTDGQMIVSGTGVLTNNVANASFSGGLSNADVVAVTAATFFKGPVTNTGAFFFQGSISNSLVNSGSFNLSGGNGTLTVAPVNTGTFNLDGDTFTVNPAWANSGTILMAGGTVAGGILTNNSGAVLSGAGTIAPLLVNNGLLVVTNGTLTLSVAPQQKGVVIVADGGGPGTLSVTPAWANNGTVSITTGGAVTGGNFTNVASGTVTNFGAINTLLVNQGQVVLGGLVSNFQQTSGTNTVSGSGSVTGTATISGGLFDLNGGTYSNGLMVLSGTGVLTSSQANATFNGGLSNAATVSFSQNTYVNGLVTNLGAFLFQGAISNNFVNAGTGTVTLNNTATITKTVTLNGGTFNLNGQTYSNGLMIVDGGTGVLTNAVAGATFNGGLSNAATVAVTATTYFNGPVTNTGAMFFQGAISNALVNVGSFNLNNNATLTVAPVNTGTINADGETLTVNPAWANAGSFQINGGVLAGGTLNNTANNNVSGSGTISNAIVNAGLITATGGTLTFAVAPTTQAGSGINVAGSGVLNVTPDWSSSGTISIAAGGALAGGTLTNTSSTGTLSGSGFIKTFLVNQGRMNWGGTISNNLLQTAGSFTVSGGATITGTATINGGTLDLVGGNLTDGLLVVGAGGTLTNGVQNATLNGGITNAGVVNLFRDTYLNGAVTNTGTWIQRGAISNNVVNAGTMTLLTNSINARVTGSIVNSGSLTFDTNGIVYVSGVVSNSGSFAFGDAISNNLVNTAGSITLIGAGTVTGNTLINGGTFDLNGKTFTNSFMVVGSSAVLTSSAANAIFNGGLSNAGTVSIAQNTTFNGAVTNMAAFAWQGTINNGYAQGAGTNFLNANSTITGSAAISDGLVNFNGKNGTFGSLNGGGGTLLNNGNGASVLTVNNGGSYSGTIADHTVGTGTLGLTVGGGVLTLSGNNSYSGVTTVNSGGTLKAGSATALGSTAGNVVVSSGGVLDLNGQAIGAEPVTLNGTGISNGGALINSSGGTASLGGAITLGSASSIGGSGDLTLSGAIGGGNNLTKVGADTVTLAAANGYTGATIINSGVLNIQNNTALGTVAGGVTVASGAALQLQGGITVGAKALSLNGTDISNDGALRNISGNNTYGGAITLAGASRVNSDAGTLTLGGGITGGGSALTIGGAGNVVVSSAIGGTGTTLTKDGAGTLNLTGNNTYTGATAVNGGTLKVNNASGSGISGGSVTINNGGTLGGTGTITVGVTVNNGGHIAPGNSVGTFNVATLTLASGSVLDFEFNSTPANDLINVLNSGGLTLNGGGFNLYQEGTATAWSTAGTYNLISYSGALAGTVGNLSVLNAAADKVYTFGNTGSMITLQIAGGQSWTGLGSDNFWSSGANWSTATPAAGDLLVFDGTTRINNTNDLTANTQFAGITYDGSAGAFTNSGNAVNLTGGIVNNSTNTQTIKLPLVLDGGNRTINAVSGALDVSGPISDTNGTWGLIKSGAGTLTLSGNTANTYSGLTTVNAGELDLNKTAGQNAIGGDLSVNNGATVRLLASEQISGTANVTVNNGGQFNLNGFAETIGGMANAGSILVGGGALTVGQTLQNSGTVTLAAGGAVAGGVLSNLSSGLVSGSGVIKSFVVNQGAMNFGGTISNNLLQTAGSFTLSGSATITGTATINGGTLDLEGNVMTNGQLVIGSGAVLQNGGGAAALNGNITNSGTVDFFLSAETEINGLVVNNGTWFQAGIISNNLVNTGTFEWLTWTGGNTPLLTGSISNSGSLALISVDAAQVNGSVTNTGTFALHGTIGGSYLQSAGYFVSSNATINGTATVTGGSFDLSGNTYTGSRMILGGTGVLTNAVAGATFNSGLSNAATVFVSQNTFFDGAITNTGTFAFMGAVSNTLVNSGDVILNGSGTITGQLANNGSVNVNSGTLSLVVAPTQTGSITVNSGATLNAAQAWVNNGTITMLGGVITNATLTNTSFITGFGTINGGGVVNNGKVFADASSISGVGTQTVRLTSFTNNNAATIGTASSNAVLNILQAGNVLINQGTVSLSGGTILFNGGAGTITNFNIIAGVGNVANFPIVNAGTLASFVAQAPLVNLSNLIATVGITNNGLLGANNLINGAATLSLTVSGGGAAIVNQGTVALQGGFLTVNGTAGTITNVNGGLIYGVGTQTLRVANLSSGKIVASNGVFSLGLQSNANAGVLSNSTAASTILLTNKFLVNTGTIELNGGGLLLSGSVITNEDIIIGPGALSSSLYNDTAGLVLVTNGVLNVATNAGESVQNLGLFTVSGDGTLNVVPSWLNTNGTVSIAGGGITGGAVTNVGLLTGFGTITSQLVNLGGGTLTASGAGSLTLVAAPTQNGWVNIASAGTLNVLPAWLNSGLVNLQGGSLVGSTVTNAGTITGFGTITPQVRNNGGGTLIANGGTLTLAVAPNQLGNVVISNAATLNVLQTWQNSGTLSLFGGTAIGSTIVNASSITGFGTITAQLQNNGGATFTATGGTLTLATAPNQAGTFVVTNSGTLNVLQAWQNSGLLRMVGGTEIGSTVTNAANVDGFGTITAPVVNDAGATLTADAGMLTLALALMQNGTVVATNGGTLNVQAAWQNSGTVSFLGGTVVGSTVTNAGTMTGFGSVQNAVNNNFMFVTNGTLQATASFTQNGTVNVAANSRLDVTPNWANAGSVLLNGGFTSGGTMTNGVSALVQGYGTISNTVVNLGTILATNGTLNLVSAPTQLGTIIIPNAATLNGVPAWQNSGSVSMQGGSVVGAQLTNAGSISGFGTFGSSVINNGGGTITASSGGALTLTAIPLQNGLVNILGTLNVASAWSNGTAGTVSINGGVLTGGTFTVDGTVQGNGTIAANMIVSNAKTVTVSGGQMNLTALTTMDGGVVNNGSVVNYGTISGDGSLNVTLSNPGYVRATNGLLYVQALAGNQATGTLEASTGGTLAANGVTPWLNNGQVILSGGTVIGGDISNNASKVISGFGTITPNVYNSGQIVATTAGLLTVNGTLVNLSGGVVAANVGNLVINGAFTNSGTLTMVNSIGTFGGPVVNSGAWVTDPTTNVFQNTYTVTSSGFIQSRAGDLYAFTNNGTTAASFINTSTNKTQYNTLAGNFLFGNTLGMTQELTVAGHDFGPVATTATNQIELFNPDPFSLPEFSNNFALGTLQISDFSTVRVDDAFITGGVGTNDDLMAGLYLNNLIMGTDSLLLISSNVQVYFITSNNWSLANIQLAGNPNYDQLFDGIHQLVVVPEPAIVLLWLSSIVTVYAARRRGASRK